MQVETFNGSPGRPGEFIGIRYLTTCIAMRTLVSPQTR